MCTARCASPLVLLIAALFVSIAPWSAIAEEKKVSEPEDSAIASIKGYIADQEVDTARNRWKEQLPPPPLTKFDPSHNYYWNLATNVGDIKIRLMSEVAPKHVASTIYLTELGFYDDLVFHRVISRFMAQGGDPIGNGSGGPGYSYDGEFDKSVTHDEPMLLSMANRGPSTDGSQFFLTFVPTPHLDGKHTIFGKVVEGKGTVRELEKRGSQSGKTSEILVIEKATISFAPKN